MVQSAIRGWLPVRKRPAWRKRHPLALCQYTGSTDFTTLRPLPDSAEDAMTEREKQQQGGDEAPCCAGC